MWSWWQSYSDWGRRSAIGIAGVNGLIELTVVTDNVPMLLPIRMLKNLRPVVDLDADVLELKAFGVKAPMQQLPSGHMSVSVVEFAPEGWALPSDASRIAQPEQFTFLFQSMTELEQSQEIRNLPSHTKHGERFTSRGEDDGASGAGGPTATSSSRECAKGQEGGPKVASSRRETFGPNAAGPRPRASNARLLLAAFGASVASGASGGAMSYYPPVVKRVGSHGQTVLEYGEIIKFASYLGLRRSKEQPRAKVETCLHPLWELKGGDNQHSKEIYCDLCKACWEYLGPDKLQEKKKQKAQAASTSTRTPGSASTGTTTTAQVVCHCKRPAFQWEVKKEGPTKGRHF